MQKAFTLVELSIVLVILGLLVGGVLAGQNLIRAAELRSVVTEYTNFQTAVMTFKEKYFAIPGDMTNATAFWGAAHATHATCLTTAGTGTQTCNGDGDEQIDATGGANRYGEMFTFWQHLVNAGFLEGSYTGRSNATGTATLGENYPESKLSASGWSVDTKSMSYAGNASEYAGAYGNYFLFGTDSSAGNSSSPALVPEEAWGIDKKIDDGKPAYGKVIARFWNNSCAAADDGSHANNDLEASYKLSDSAIRCALFFRQQF